MKSLLILKRLKVENANALSGIVYGFPAITHFLGYIHALSRELTRRMGDKFKLEGCGIICHKHQVQSHSTGGWGDHLFSLTRNPLTKKAESAPFNEEGRIHMEISLIVECDFTGDDLDFGTGDIGQEIQKLEELVYQLALARPLAGGHIANTPSISFKEIPKEETKKDSFYRRIKRSLLPGFVLRDRSDLFKKHLIENPHLDHLEAMLDFYTLKSQAVPSDEKEVGGKIDAKWHSIPKPCSGWLVPIQLGYQAISSLYRAGEVADVRDSTVPFCFVEPLYGLGEWVGLHRIRDLETMLWRHLHDGDTYLCINKFND